jgi:multidrug efflux pump subunit AcrA (membrane-fusion protein)
MVRVALTPDPNLRPGAFARAEVTVSNRDRAVLPQTAVLTDDKGSTYVLIVNGEHKIERRTVHVSGMVQDGVTITDGVSGKDQVVATAGAFLQEGELVNPVIKESVRS